MKIERKEDMYTITWEDGKQDKVSARILDIIINGVCPDFQSYQIEELPKGRCISFDFDGVIHSYVSKWVAPEIIPDPPVEGMKEEIELLKKKGRGIIINSSRARTVAGKMAIREYMDKNNIPYDYITSTKMPSVVYVDDRAMLFDGEAKGLADKICAFRKPKK